MLRTSLSLGIALLLFPSILISEPPAQGKTSASDVPSLEVLFSGITPMDDGSSVMIRLDGEDLQTLGSACHVEQTLLKSDENFNIIQWKPLDNCTFPLVTYEGASYILPISGSLPSREILSDVSTETLKNTLRASAILQADYRLSSLRLREFFRNIEAILVAREMTFALPIPEIPLPTNISHLPNSPRPFRSESTDGVHHGWDFYVDRGTPVRAIEGGTIMHVKRDFSWDELRSLYASTSELNKQMNLDVYRGNTVYLKTLSGHVAIYAHLMNIPDNIQIGIRVQKGDVVGHVGDSAVPDKKYLYHLHLELALNPLIDKKAGTYDFNDVLLWPFWGKGKSLEWIRDNDETLFE